jgi:PIN domain nuclease of toxin-antitoxin system
LRLLLDTHIWAWTLLEPHRVKRTVAAAIASEQSELWLSPISTWELALLVEKGRIALEFDLDDWLAQATLRLRVQHTTFTHEIARESRRVGLCTRTQPTDFSPRRSKFSS